MSFARSSHAPQKRNAIKTSTRKKVKKVKDRMSGNLEHGDTNTTTRPLYMNRLIAPFLSRAQRALLASAQREGRLREIQRVELLDPQQLPQLARQSLQLLLASGLAFIALNVVARITHGSGPLLGAGSPLARGALLITTNIAAYALMIPIHEALHATIIIGLGGHPRFGLKLPFAAYCTAPDQLFTRNGYIVVALAPLVGLTLAGAALTWFAPDLGACLLFGLAGNVAGAVGDLATVARLRRIPSSALISDTQDGYTAYSAE